MDNHWVGHSLMKQVDSKSFQRRKDTKEGGDDKNDDFDMEILEKGPPQKTLNTENKDPDEKYPRKTIYEVIEDDYFDESYVNILKKFLTKCRTEFNVTQSIPHEVKRKIQKVCL